MRKPHPRRDNPFSAKAPKRPRPKYMLLWSDDHWEIVPTEEIEHLLTEAGFVASDVISTLQLGRILHFHGHAISKIPRIGKKGFEVAIQSPKEVLCNDDLPLDQA